MLAGTRLVGIVTASDMLDVVDDVDGMLDVALGRVRRGTREGQALSRGVVENRESKP